MVKHSRRFTSLAMSRVVDSDNILEDLGAILRDTDGIFHTITTGTTLYRTRSLERRLMILLDLMTLHLLLMYMLVNVV